MALWAIHWLEAEGTLEPWREAIAAEIRRAEAAFGRMLPPPRLDVLVARRGAGAVMPETGSAGFAHGPSMLMLSVYPGNPRFEAALQDGDVARAALHEAHHCLRMAGPGYGDTLGEALVSEGLAGRFVAEALGSGPEPWERVMPEAEALGHLPDAALADRGYDHGEWFFGTGALPRWLGYTLGFALAGRWLAATPPEARDWAGVPASEVLAAARA